MSAGGDGGPGLPWRDDSSYRQGAERVPTQWAVEVGRLRLVIHRYIGCGKALFLSVHDMRIDRHDLQTEDAAVAQARAERLVVDTLVKDLAALHRASRSSESGRREGP